jgi:hypothetical protein
MKVLRAIGEVLGILWIVFWTVLLFSVWFVAIAIAGIVAPKKSWTPIDKPFE